MESNSLLLPAATPHSTFIIFWALATFIGLIFAYLTANFLNSGLAAFMSAGFIIGSLQYLAIRKYLPKPWYWIVANIIAFPVGFLVPHMILFPRNPHLGAYFVIPLITIVQWFYLQMSLKRSFIWIVILNLLVFLPVSFESGTNAWLFTLELIAACLITGVVLYLLIRYSSREILGDA